MAPSVSLKPVHHRECYWLGLDTFVVLLSRQRSIAAVLLAALAAVTMASGPAQNHAGRYQGPSTKLGPWPVKERGLFAEYLNTAPREMHGFLIAVCLYGGAIRMARKIVPCLELSDSSMRVHG